MPNHIQSKLQIIGSKMKVKEVFAFIAAKDEDGKDVQIDFNKIIPMPDELNIEVHSGIKTWVDICTGQIDFTPLFNGLPKSSAELLKDGQYGTLANSLNAHTAMEHITGKREGNVKDFSDLEFDIFVKCLKNNRTHGFASWFEWRKKNWGTKWNAYDQNDERNTADTIYFQTAWSCPLIVIAELSKLFPNCDFKIDYADEDSGSNAGIITFRNGEATEVFQPESQSKEAYELFFNLHPGRKENYKLVNDKYEYIDED